MRKAMEERVSVRSYSADALRQEDIDFIKEELEKINAEFSLCCYFFDDAAFAFENLSKSYGMFKNVRSVAVMQGSADDDEAYEKIGFAGERLILDLCDKGIGTCWVGGTFDRSAFKAEDGRKTACLITLGYPADYRLRDRVMYSVLHKRKPASERITSDGEIPEVIMRGVEAAVKAPSAVNSQKPHFTLTGKTLSVGVPGDSSMDAIDLGIVKYHFFDETKILIPFGNNSSVDI